MKERLTRVWRTTYPLVAFGGGAVALISFFFGDLGEIIDRLRPYETPIIGGGLLLFILVYYGWVLYLVYRGARGIGKGILAWRQRREDSRKLRLLAPRITRLKQYHNGRFINYELPENAMSFYENLIKSQTSLRPELEKLNVPAPIPAPTPRTQKDAAYFIQIEKWEDYLDMLSPLAVRGDLREARMILHRLEAWHKSNRVVTQVVSFSGDSPQEPER